MIVPPLIVRASVVNASVMELAGRFNVEETVSVPTVAKPIVEDAIVLAPVKILLAFKYAKFVVSERLVEARPVIDAPETLRFPVTPRLAEVAEVRERKVPVA